MKKKPKPGSDEAIEQGCTCPVLDNGHGRGSARGENIFWISGDCKLHHPSLHQSGESKK